MSKQEEDSGLKCANHPNVTTYVRCSKCGKPICTRCMFATPVGYRCADCYNPQIAPLYKIDPSKLPLAIGGGLLLSAIGGVLVAFFPDFAFFIALLMGFLVSDTIGRLSNQKHGPIMQYIGIGCIVVSLAVALALYSLLHPGALNYIFDVATPVYQLPSYSIDLARFSNSGNGQIDLFTLIMFGLAAFMAWIRLR